MSRTGVQDNASYIQIGGKSPDNGHFTPEHDSGFLTAVWASVQKPTSGNCIGQMDLCTNKLQHVTGHLRNIDGKFQSLRELFQREGAVISGAVEAKLAELLQAISSLLSKYPALNCAVIQLATSALITSVNGKSPTRKSQKCVLVIVCTGVVLKSSGQDQGLIVLVLHIWRQVSGHA
ncbi:unnamed protein product [Eretmochelys imbricata]